MPSAAAYITHNRDVAQETAPTPNIITAIMINRMVVCHREYRRLGGESNWGVKLNLCSRWVREVESVFVAGVGGTDLFFFFFFCFFPPPARPGASRRVPARHVVPRRFPARPGAFFSSPSSPPGVPRRVPVLLLLPPMCPGASRHV